MRFTVAAVVAVPLAALSPLVPAQAPASDQDHAAHHPAGASAPAPAPKAPTSKPQKAAPSSTASDTTMKSMRAMHDKMMAAKTAAERQALMADHMKAMQDGMAMMGQMKGEKAGMSSEAMAKRMDMMEMMMQMMMDREAAHAPAAK
ncbi:MAG TPA: hypothetical protein VF169_03385 [Albitalea sp.]|uniref:hypothetical protein n=1 Tax=Piscinibacter sp. TaxID=1903157 RepID=UPI002ED27347